jgi:6,7-dimethyl-8-ribityllumazine synthase
MNAAATGPRALVVVSRFNEGVTRKLLAGATQALAAGGYPTEALDVVWVPGAFEIPLALQQGLVTGRYTVAVALGAVVRGETPHFDVVVSTASDGIAKVGMDTGVPVGFGLLTCDTQAQALDRAGGSHGNKGAEAADAALEMQTVLEALARGG